MTKVYNNQNVAYALNQPLVVGAPQPIVSQRAPTANDTAQIGTLWVDTATDSMYVLTSITIGQAHWEATTGGAGVFAALTVNPGPTNITGTTNINTAGAATTTIGTGGTGAVRIGNVTGNTQVTGSLTATSLAATTTILAGTTVTAGTGMTATTGNITATTGNIVVTAGDVVLGAGSVTLNGAGAAVEFVAGPWVIAGNGAPVGPAPQGTLYLRADGSSTTTRAYINTDGNTGWTSVTTAT